MGIKKRRGRTQKKQAIQNIITLSSTLRAVLEQAEQEQEQEQSRNRNWRASQILGRYQGSKLEPSSNPCCNVEVHTKLREVDLGATLFIPRFVRDWYE